MMTMIHSKLKQYTEANRAAWNEVMPRHRQAAKEKLDKMVSKPGFVLLDEVEIELLQQVDLNGKSVVHLCCNNGIELMSLKNLGAAECVGFDISEEAVKEAGERAVQSRIDCQFIRSDVYEIEAGYAGRFDIVYISAGCLGWMPDLKLFFQKASDLLQKHGLIFIHEIHPFSEMLPRDDAVDADSLRIVEPYFKSEPYIDYGGLDYIGRSQYTSTLPQYWFIHKMSDILMALIENRISMEQFSEYETDISAGHKRIEQIHAGVPLSYILIGRK
jgi:2-polyprenyl-3-methyl-5-hydroxy-6-metoxy-1,4-benzoquinol methylase